MPYCAPVRTSKRKGASGTMGVTVAFNSPAIEFSPRSIEAMPDSVSVGRGRVLAETVPEPVQVTTVCSSVELLDGLEPGSVMVGLDDGPEPESFDAEPDATVAAMAVANAHATAIFRNAPLLLSPDSNVPSQALDPSQEFWHRM